MILIETILKMSRRSKSQIEVECNFIKQYMEQNLKLGLTHEDIIKQLGISRSTYFRHVRRIYKEYEKVWDQCYVGSATYYASQLVQRLEETINLCKTIRDNDKEDSKVRMEASQTMCIAEAQLYKIMESGPTFWPTLPVFPKNHQPELTDNDTDTKQLPN